MNIEHSYPFDPTNGKTLSELLQIQPGKEAPDFRSFWEENYELTMAMRPTYYIEKEMAKQGLDLSKENLDKMENLWNEAKKQS